LVAVGARAAAAARGARELDGRARIDALCEQFTRAFAAPPPGEKGTGNTF